MELIESLKWVHLLIGFNVGLAVALIFQKPVRALVMWFQTPTHEPINWRKIPDKPDRGMYIGLRRGSE